MSDAPTRLAAALSDRYRIERELGEGGMATVYLAEDLKHDRKVALKVLRPELAAVLGADRFVQEIKTTAALQHPHILPLFDSGEADGFLFYVMPYVEGETLRQKLDRETQLSIDEAVKITTEVADALDYAHRHGVVHRDIKPENILLHDGRPMVADFGIALALSAAAGGRMTETGMSLGTPHYMSPEQATADKDITGRSDIYSLASVLYEMLTGNPPHVGSSAQQIIMRIIAEDVKPVTAIRESVPPNVAAALAQALEKLPADRFDSAKAFAEALTNPSFTTASAAPAAPAALHRSRMTIAALAAACVVVGGGLGWLLHRAPTPPHPPEIRFDVAADSGWTITPLAPAVSPDGSAIVATEWAGARARLILRRMDATVAHPIPGTESGVLPFFSPDGQWIGFGVHDAVKKVRLDGSTPITIAHFASGLFGGGSWGADGTIIYSVWPSGVFRVPAAGGTPTRVDARDSLEQVYLPALIGQGPAFVATTTAKGIRQTRGVLVDPRAGRVTDLGEMAFPHVLPSGVLVYVTLDGQIMQQPFDVRSRRLTGSPTQVASGVVITDGVPAFAMAENGTFAYLTGVSGDRDLRLVDRNGTSTVLAHGPGIWVPRFSPNGRRIVYGANAQNATTADVWTRDLGAGTTQRLTYRGYDSNDPEWSPDGTKIAFSAGADSASTVKDLYLQAADGSGAPTLLLHQPETQWTSDWTRDGKTILFTDVSPKSGYDIWTVGSDGQDAKPYLATPFDEEGARVSYDTHWIAYTSDQTGRNEVYVQSFPTPGNRVVVSVDGGRDPAWRGDGREIYYWNGDQLMAAEFTPGAPPTVTKRRVLFTARYVTGTHANYDVTADGTRFVIVTGSGASSDLTVVVNGVRPGR
ncbi:MAG TPA: protein kinase [Gemmatimonadales bacterium]|nr:protein kinase [Gemmatimonadales bacterium]